MQKNCYKSAILVKLSIVNLVSVKNNYNNYKETYNKIKKLR